MIERVLLLADQSARYVLGGLSQRDRLLRLVQEWGGVPDSATRVVTPSDDPIPPPAHGGETLVIRSDVVMSRGVLRQLLDRRTTNAPLAVIPAGGFPSSFSELVALPRGNPDLPGVWLIGSARAVPAIERQLFASLGKPTDGVVSRLLNRPLSRRLSRLLCRLGVLPNQISVAVLVILLAGLGFLMQGTPRGFVIGMLLYQAASILDGCDGEIARVSFRETRVGAMLDTSVDFAGNLLLALAIGIGLSRQRTLPDNVRSDYLLEGILTAAGIVLGLVGLRLARLSQGGHFKDVGSGAVARWRVPFWLRAVLNALVQLLRRDSFTFWFTVWALMGHPEWILHAMAIGIALHFPVIGWWWWQVTKSSAPLRAPE